MKNPGINGLMADAVRRVLRGASRAGNADVSRRPGRQGPPSCESLEGRVVLSNWGGADLVGGLSQIGVVTRVLGDAGGLRGGPMMAAPGAGQTSETGADDDLQALQAKIQELAAKSSVTVADLSALASDSKAILDAGGGVKADDLQTVLSSLATAVAGGSDTTQARSDFNALFSDSKVDQDAIDKSFNDLVQTIKDSNVTTTDLTDFASALSALPKPGIAVKAPGFGGGPGGFVGTGSQGGALAASLARAGVTAAPTGRQGDDATPGDGSKSDQLQTDLDKLRTDQQTVAAKSEVTSDDLDQLKTDSKNMASAGLQLDPRSLQAVINNLVAAVAGGSDTSRVKSDFNGLFSQSKVDQAVIDQTFDDLVRTIQDSKISSADASLIADDQAAAQADLVALPQGGPGGGFMGRVDQAGFAGGLHGGPGGMVADQGDGFGFAQGSRGGLSLSRGGRGMIQVGQGGGQIMDRGGPGMVQSGRIMASPVAREDSAAPTSTAGAGVAMPADAVRPADSNDGSDPGGPTDVAPGAASASDNAMGARGHAGVRGRFVRSMVGRFGRVATGGTQGFASGAGRQGRSMNGSRRG